MNIFHLISTIVSFDILFHTIMYLNVYLIFLVVCTCIDCLINLFALFLSFFFVILLKLFSSFWLMWFFKFFFVQRHLNSHNQTGMSSHPGSSPSSSSSTTRLINGPSTVNVSQLQDDLMTLRLREAESLADAREARQKLMENESRSNCLQNQIRRQEEENASLRSMYDKLQENITLLEQRLREEMTKREDLESEVCYFVLLNLFFFPPFLV